MLQPVNTTGMKQVLTSSRGTEWVQQLQKVVALRQPESKAEVVTMGPLSWTVQDRDTEGSEGTEQAPMRPTSARAEEDPPATPATPVWAAVKAQQVFPCGVLNAQDPHRERSSPVFRAPCDCDPWPLWPDQPPCGQHRSSQEMCHHFL